MTDTELLDWFEHTGAEYCMALLSDDDGRWAVSINGGQSIPVEAWAQGKPGDVDTYFSISANDWKPSIREALLAAKTALEE